MRRWNWPLIGLAFAWILAIWLGWSLHSRAVERAERAADLRLATEIAANAVREAGWEVTLAGVTRDLTQRMDDTLAAILATHAAEPVAVATVEVHVTDTVTVYAEDQTPGAIWRAQVRDGLLWADLTVDEGQRSVEVAYRVEARCELIGAIMPDSRLMVAARAVDERAGCDVPALYWAPPKPPPGPSRTRWMIAGIAIGVVGWELVR